MVKSYPYIVRSEAKGNRKKGRETFDFVTFDF